MPKISLEEARGILGKRGKLSLRRRREMKKVELVYLPYFIHRVAVSQGEEEYEIVVCTDGIAASFSFFNPEHSTFGEVASGEIFDFIVPLEDAERACLENLRWHLVRQGLRLKVKASIKEIRETRRMHYPYWVAYFKGASGYQFRAADAVTGQIQGVRTRSTFLNAFSQSDNKDCALAPGRNSLQGAQSV
jgi:hypothetical protein